jgi:hypothetical protein
MSEWTWQAVHDSLAEHPARTVMPFPKAWLPDPRTAGASVSVGVPHGQIADYRFPPDAECRGLHAQDFGTEWRVHLDRVHPSCDLVGHFVRDVL